MSGAEIVQGMPALGIIQNREKIYVPRNTRSSIIIQMMGLVWKMHPCQQ